jgi:hypothetical protein
LSSADEHVNADVKYGVDSKKPKRTKEGLKAAAEEHMNMPRNRQNGLNDIFLIRPLPMPLMSEYILPG